MAFKGIDTARQLDYRSPYDPDKENPTIFGLRSPSKRIVNFLRDQAIANEGAAEGNIQLANPFGIMYEYVRFGLVSLRNFTDSKDNLVEFATEQVTVPGVGKVMVVRSDILDQFPDSLIHELAREVQQLTSPTEEEAGNSDGSS